MNGVFFCIIVQLLKFLHKIFHQNESCLNPFGLRMEKIMLFNTNTPPHTHTQTHMHTIFPSDIINQTMSYTYSTEICIVYGRAPEYDKPIAKYSYKYKTRKIDLKFINTTSFKLITI